MSSWGELDRPTAQVDGVQYGRVEPWVQDADAGAAGAAEQRAPYGTPSDVAEPPELEADRRAYVDAMYTRPDARTRWVLVVFGLIMAVLPLVQRWLLGERGDIYAALVVVPVLVGLLVGGPPAVQARPTRPHSRSTSRVRRPRGLGRDRAAGCARRERRRLDRGADERGDVPLPRRHDSDARGVARPRVRRPCDPGDVPLVGHRVDRRGARARRCRPLGLRASGYRHPPEPRHTAGVHAVPRLWRPPVAACARALRHWSSASIADFRNARATHAVPHPGRPADDLRRSAADRAHRAVGLQERRVVDVVAGLLAGQAAAERVGERLVDVGGHRCRARCRGSVPMRSACAGPTPIAAPSDGAGPRSSSRTSVSVCENRHARSWPSAVSRSRSHAPQNGAVTDAMTPTVAGPPSTVQSSAGAAPRPGTSVSVNAPVRRVEDLRLRHHLGAVPGVPAVQRHLLDEPHLVPAVDGEPGQRRPPRRRSPRASRRR